MWEDPANKGGGAWTFMLEQSQGQFLNQFWENIVSHQSIKLLILNVILILICRIDVLIVTATHSS